MHGAMRLRRSAHTVPPLAAHCQSSQNGGERPGTLRPALRRGAGGAWPLRPDRRRHPATGGPGGGSAGGGGGLSAGGGCRWRLAEASRDGRVSERETASAGGGQGACAGGGGAGGARAVRAGRDECHGTHTHIYILISRRASACLHRCRYTRSGRGTAPRRVAVGTDGGLLKLGLLGRVGLGRRRCALRGRGVLGGGRREGKRHRGLLRWLEQADTRISAQLHLLATAQLCAIAPSAIGAAIL